MAKLNKNRIKLGDIVFVNMNNVASYDDYVGKVMQIYEKSKVEVRHADGYWQSVFINRCKPANETQRKHYFKDVLGHG